MNINLILSTYGFSENIFYNQVGRLKGYTLKVLNFINESLQNKTIAVTTVIVSNVVFSEIALETACCVSDFLESTKQLQDLIKNDHIIHNIHHAIYFGSCTLSVTLLNLALYKSVSLNLSPIVYTALSVATCAVCFMRNEKFWAVSSCTANKIKKNIIEPLYSKCFG